LINVDIRTSSGRFVARVDMLFDDFGEILEYQGAHHRSDVRQWRRDRIRESELESMGYHVMEVVSDDLRDPARLIRRIEANLRRRGWTGHAVFDA
jgi:very-short-patch-repair endonuclease